jgi:toxin HigB-1
MIKSVRGTATRQFIETGKSKFSGLDVQLAKRRVVTLARAASLADFGDLASVGLHKLKR